MKGQSAMMKNTHWLEIGFHLTIRLNERMDCFQCSPQAKGNEFIIAMILYFPYAAWLQKGDGV